MQLNYGVGLRLQHARKYFDAERWFALARRLDPTNEAYNRAWHNMHLLKRRASAQGLRQEDLSVPKINQILSEEQRRATHTLPAPNKSGPNNKRSCLSRFCF